ncbi:glycosyl transferase family 90 [Actibacterium pelagium]|uniref:Glycosyl transferase CAP10 domain-containing protein n=1 Tax=Actibacterium pelagium TaxID=2029103 RepID=A0A917AE97_9RHOB|nr:glycosyl transferase family 90 [Actibacterium pelagium]GGE46660.1 hypothetical protein GCM10011517_12960 [Actibacterium pelagium]
MIKTIPPGIWRIRLERRIRKRIRKYGLKDIDPAFRSVRFEITDDPITPWDLQIERREGAIVISWRAEALEGGKAFEAASNRSSPYMYYFAKAGPKAVRIVCDISDGNLPSCADIGFSSFLPDRGLVPDLYFFQSGGYAEQRRQVAEHSVPWSERDDQIVWRGGLNNTGFAFGRPDMTENGIIAQRLRLAYACRGTDIDVKFVAGFDATPILQAEGLMGDRVAAETWLDRKYALDIDGHSNAWDNLYHRLLFGCCVLKVESQPGFRQWYYDKLKPYEHYVPIKADLSDLHQQVDWARSHPAEAEAIAHQGSELAHSMTFESEMAYAAEEVRKRCRNR